MAWSSTRVTQDRLRRHDAGDAADRLRAHRPTLYCRNRRLNQKAHAMRAVGYQKSLPIDNEASLTDVELPAPEPKGRDLLVEIRAVSVNPIDTKVRKRAGAEPPSWKVLGF